MRMIAWLPLCLITSVASGADLRPPSTTENYLEALTKPVDTHDAVTKGITTQLSTARVPTAEKAQTIALQSFGEEPGPGLRANEGVAVTGLYRLGRDQKNFGAAGDLVWEVRVWHDFKGVSGVIWVSSSTGAARILFP